MKIPTGLVIGTFALVAVSAASPVLADGHRHKHGGDLVEEIKKMVSNAEHAAVITKRRDAMQDLGGHEENRQLREEERGRSGRRHYGGDENRGDSKNNTRALPPGNRNGDLSRCHRRETRSLFGFHRFQGCALKMASLAMDLAKAAGSGASKSDLGAKFGMIEQGCGGCHRTYRKKLKK